MERIINSVLLDYLLNNSLISKEQHGFVKRKSTCTNLLECLDQWTMNMQSRFITDVIYFDFRKAFDTVSHPKLLVKLSAYGLSGNLLVWIQAFLSNRLQSVRIGNSTSSPASVTSGVPQGSVLGPTLFLLFINDVPGIFDGLMVSCKLYADDVKLFSFYGEGKPHGDLQEAIDRLVRWSEVWQLSLSPAKCYAFRIQNPCWTFNSDCHSMLYNINGTNLEFRPYATDLGITFEGDLKFKKYIAMITRAAHLRARLILKSFVSRNRKLLAKAFTVYVRPILEYCTPIWNPHHLELIDRIENVQRWFSRCLSGLHDLCYEDRLRNLGWQSLRSRRVRNDLVLCYNIVHDNLDVELGDGSLRFATSRTRGHRYKLCKPLCLVDTRKFFFACRTVDAWNALPEHVVTANDVFAFKRRVCNLMF
jgi:ribonucleases P/MRP protein subunit RPP40